MKEPSKNKARKKTPEETRENLVQAAVQLILNKGYNATRVDEICAKAEVTKGAFFHHFKSKEDLGEAAIHWWSKMGREAYAEAWDNDQSDPLQRLHLMTDIMEDFVKKNNPCSCLLGMMAQECSQTHPRYQEICDRNLAFWSAQVTELLAGAKSVHPYTVDFDPEGVARFINSLWQGSMLLSKTHRNNQIILDNLVIVRNYINDLFETNQLEDREPQV